MAKVLIENISYLNDPQCFSENYEHMSAYRRAALDNMKLQKDRMLSLGAGILLNKALDSCGLSGEYTIAYGKYGKPYFPQIKDQFRFSLSHSETEGTADDPEDESPKTCGWRWIIFRQIELITSFMVNSSKDFPIEEWNTI